MNDMNDILFFICISLQILSFFIKTSRIKMWLFIGAALASLVLCFTSPVGFIWLIVTILNSLNAFMNYKKKDKTNLPTYKF